MLYLLNMLPPAPRRAAPSVRGSIAFIDASPGIMAAVPAEGGFARWISKRRCCSSQTGVRRTPNPDPARTQPCDHLQLY